MDFYTSQVSVSLYQVYFKLHSRVAIVINCLGLKLLHQFYDLGEAFACTSLQLLGENKFIFKRDVALNITLKVLILVFIVVLVDVEPFWLNASSILKTKFVTLIPCFWCELINVTVENLLIGHLLHFIQRLDVSNQVHSLFYWVFDDIKLIMVFTLSNKWLWTMVREQTVTNFIVCLEFKLFLGWTHLLSLRILFWLWKVWGRFHMRTFLPKCRRLNFENFRILPFLRSVAIYTCWYWIRLQLFALGFTCEDFIVYSFLGWRWFRIRSCKKAGLQVLDEFLGLTFQFLGLVVDGASLLVIKLTVCPYLLNVCTESLIALVNIILYILSESLKVHWFLNYSWVVEQPHCFPRHRLVEGIRVVISLQLCNQKLQIVFVLWFDFQAALR